MKRLTISLVLVIFTACFGFSQFSLLLEGGANYGKAKLTKNDLIQNDNILGYYISGIPKYKLANRLSLFSEFQYSVEGFGFNGISGQTKNNFHYIRIVPGVELNIFGPLSLIGGFNYGYLAVANDQNGVNIPKGIFEKNDLGILAGFNIALSNFNIAVKYNYGLASVFDLQLTDVQGNELEDLKTKNRFLQIGVGYRIDFKI